MITDIQIALSILSVFRERDNYMVELPSDLYFMQKVSNEELFSLEASFENQTFQPSVCTYINSPKPKGMIRQFAKLTVQDQLYYTWLVVKCFPNIHAAINPSFTNSREILINYRHEHDWMKKYFRGQKSFFEHQCEIVQTKHKWLFKSDITNFSPSIDHELLYSNLINSGANNVYANSLKSALNRWSQLPGRGLPQIFWATDVLQEFYLNPFEIFLKEKKMDFVRLQDNIEIYCETKTDCKSIFKDTVLYLSKIGMHLNESKTIFETTNELKDKISGKKNFKSTVKSLAKTLPYDLNKFYYGLEEKLNIVNCEERMLNHPHDTKAYLMHYKKIGLDISSALSKIIVNENLDFEFQRYTILRWILDHPSTINNSITKALLKLLQTKNIVLYSRSCAIQILASHNNNAINKELIDIISHSNDSELQREFSFIQMLASTNTAN